MLRAPHVLYHCACGAKAEAHLNRERLKTKKKSTYAA